MIEQFLAEFFEGIVAMYSGELLNVGECLGIDFDRRATGMRFGLCGSGSAVSTNQVLDKGVADGEAFGEFSL